MEKENTAFTLGRANRRLFLKVCTNVGNFCSKKLKMCKGAAGDELLEVDLAGLVAVVLPHDGVDLRHSEVHADQPEPRGEL